MNASLERVAECLYRNHRGTYFALVKVAGKQIKRSLRTKDRQFANRRLTSFREKTARLEGSAQRDLRFGELCDQWLESIKPLLKPSSYARRVSSIHSIKPHLQNQMARSVTVEHIDHWKSSRGKEISARTYNIDLETLRLLFTYAKDVKRIILENPVENIRRKKEPKITHAIPTKDQFSALIGALRKSTQAGIPGGAADLMEFLGYSGCRIGEAVEVRWNHINYPSGTLLITGGVLGTKNHEHRTIPLFPPLRELLERMEKDRQGRDRVFTIRHSRNANQLACERIGLPSFTHHSMRHFFCSNAIEAGIDFKVIAGWLGHKDGGILVAKTYGHLRAEHSAEMAKRMVFRASSA